MATHLIVVEGAHDAAFFVKLLQRRGFSLAQKLDQLNDFWASLVPTKYPNNPDNRLDRVMTFPEFLSRDDGHTVGVCVAGSDSRLVETMRAIIDAKSPLDFASLSVVIDTDREKSEQQRFSALRQSLENWNAVAVEEGQEGFPLKFPSEPQTIASGSPRFGIFLFPGNGQQGTLEGVLMNCVRNDKPDLIEAAEAYLDKVQSSYPEESSLAASRDGSGREKAICGAIANVLRPGSSLAVSLKMSSWVPKDESVVPEVQEAANFIDKLIA